MKKYLQAVFVAALAATSAQAAEYKPLLEPGKSWTIRYKGTNYSSDNPYFYGIGMPSFYQMFTVTVEGDTIVDNKQCWQIVRKEYCQSATNSIYSKHILCEEGEIVSICNTRYDGSNVFIPMVRFDVSVGDSLRVYLENGDPINEYHRIESCDLVIGNDGVERREISIGNSSWVEGVGFSKSFLFMIENMSGQQSFSDVMFETVDCSLNGESIFMKKDFKLQFEDKTIFESMFTPGKSWTMARTNEEFTVSVVGVSYVHGIPATTLIDSNGKEYTMIEHNNGVYTFFDYYGAKDPLRNAVPLMSILFKENSVFNRYEFGKEWNWDEEKEDLTNRHKCKVREINLLTVNGIERKEWVIEDENGQVVGSWVEGIGSPDAKSWVDMRMPADYDLRMIDCRQDGEVIFTADDFTYQSSISEVTAPETARRGIYDLQGRRVATPARGLYIVDGQKRLLK